MSQYYEFGQTTGRQKNYRLREVVAAGPKGWSATEVFLSRSAREADHIYSLLNYDDYQFHEFQQGPKRFGVFVCYWRSGKMSPHLVATHTPDRCWVLAGWSCQEYRRREFGDAVRVAYQAGYWRRFSTPDGAELEVLFWHFVGDQVQNYGGNGFNYVLPAHYWIKSAIQFGLGDSKDQYFVRITTQGRMADILDDPAVAEYLSKFENLDIQLVVPDKK